MDGVRSPYLSETEWLVVLVSLPFGTSLNWEEFLRKEIRSFVLLGRVDPASYFVLREEWGRKNQKSMR